VPVSRSISIVPLPVESTPVSGTPQSQPWNVLSGEDAPWRRWVERLIPVRPGRNCVIDTIKGRDALAVLDASPDAILVLDSSGRVTVASQTATVLLGREVSDVLGRPFDLLLHPDSRPVAALRIRWLVDDQMCGGVVDLDAVQALRADGSTVPVSVRMSRIPTRGGPALCVSVRDQSQAALRDVEVRTGQAEKDQLQATLTATLRAVGDRAIIVTDDEGMIASVNRATEKLLGYASDELIGRPLTVLSDPQDIASAAAELGIETGMDPLLEVTRSGLPNNLDWTFVTQAGERMIVGLKIVPIGASRNPSGFVCVAHQELSLGWQPTGNSSGAADRLLLALDDAPTRTLRWQFRGGSAASRRR
jgi:PAS domain S-box-containing protein